MPFFFADFPEYSSKGHEGNPREEIKTTYGVVECSYTPLGLKHARIPLSSYSPAFEDYIREEIGAVSLSVTIDTIFQPELFDAGFYLRTPLVRWFAPVYQTDEEFFRHLKKKWRNNLRNHWKKAQEVDVSVEDLGSHNLQSFLDIYRSTVTQKEGGFEIFYLKQFETEGVPEGLKAVVFREPETAEVLGVSVVNTWGSHQDIGKEPRKYCATQVAAFSEKGKEYDIGYYDFYVAIQLAREYGDTYVSAGGDVNVWGADVSTGLLHQKSIAGFTVYPYGPIQYFKILDEQKILEVSKDNGISFFSLNPDAAAVQSALKKEAPIIGNKVEDIDATELWRCEWIGSDTKTCSTPMGIEVNTHILLE